MKITKKLNISKLLPLLLVLIGNIAFAFSVKLFILPAKLISCGTTGRFVTNDHAVLDAMRQKAVDAAVRDAAEQFRALGIRLSEAAAELLKLEEEHHG